MLTIVLARKSCRWHRSTFCDFDDRFGKGLRGFLRQIVPDAALDGPVRIFAGEFPGIGIGVRMRCAVGVAFKRNGGHGDARAFGKPPIQVVIFGIAFSQAEPPAIIMNYDGDMIGVVPKSRRRWMLISSDILIASIAESPSFDDVCVACL